MISESRSVPKILLFNNVENKQEKSISGIKQILSRALECRYCVSLCSVYKLGGKLDEGVSSW